MKASILLLSLSLAFPVAAHAKGKKAKADAEEQKRKKEGRPPAPGDKGTNEGAQGRKNATEGAASDADSPTTQHRP